MLAIAHGTLRSPASRQACRAIERPRDSIWPVVQGKRPPSYFITADASSHWSSATDFIATRLMAMTFATMFHHDRGARNGGTVVNGQVPSRSQ